MNFVYQLSLIFCLIVTCVERNEGSVELSRMIGRYSRTKTPPWKTTSQAPSVLTLTIGFLLPDENLTNPTVRNRLRHYLADGLTPKSVEKRDLYSPRNVRHRLLVNPIYTKGLGLANIANNVFCSPGTRGLNTIFILTDKDRQGNNGNKIAKFVDSIASSVGIPTLVWSTAAAELEPGSGNTNRILLAPGAKEQAQTIFSFIKTQMWQKISIIGTSQTPGFDTFVSNIWELSDQEQRNLRKHSIHFGSHTLNRLEYVAKLDTMSVVREALLYIRDTVQTETIIVYSHEDEANDIFSEARTLGMTAEQYLWLCGNHIFDKNQVTVSPNSHFVPGIVAIAQDIDPATQIDVLTDAVHLWSAAVKNLLSELAHYDYDEEELEEMMAPAPFCNSNSTPTPWEFSEIFVDILKKTKSKMQQEDTGHYLPERKVNLMYLDSNRRWVRFGVWSQERGLVANETNFRDIKQGTTQDTILRVVTLEEHPYVIYGYPDKVGKCPHQAVPCEIKSLQYLKINRTEMSGTFGPNDQTDHITNGSMACCSGLCIDLLQKLAADIGFRYHIFEVEDRKWGVRDKNTGQWNGLLKALLDNKADLVMTSLKINKERSEAIDFGIPFLETGITMVVAIKPGAISPMAFLEPFSPAAWMAILVGCVNAVVFSSSLFEFVTNFRSKDTSNTKAKKGMRPFFSSLWRTWAMLFKASVKVHIPQSMGAKLLTGIWGAFCVIFASSYMANLAVFMITKDDFYDFDGIDDYRLQNPFSKNPPYAFGTLSSGATEAFMRTNYPELFDYMRQFNQTSVAKGVNSVKSGY